MGTPNTTVSVSRTPSGWLSSESAPISDVSPSPTPENLEDITVLAMEVIMTPAEESGRVQLLLTLRFLSMNFLRRVCWLLVNQNYPTSPSIIQIINYLLVYISEYLCLELYY